MNQQAAQKGLALAQGALGEIYKYGHGVKADEMKSLHWFSLAVAQEDPAARHHLGLYYLNAANDLKNVKAGIALLEESANQGFPASMHELGGCYFNGKDIQLDYVKAKEWYEKAANRNHAASIYMLGKVYCEGLGVKEDKAIALKLFQKANRIGNAEVKLGLAELYAGDEAGVQNCALAYTIYASILCDSRHSSEAQEEMTKLLKTATGTEVTGKITMVVFPDGSKVRLNVMSPQNVQKPTNAPR